MNIFLAGTCSGLTGSLLFQPLEVLKTRLQESPRSNLHSITSCIYQTSGLKGFWRGTTISALRIVPSSGLFFVTILHYRYLALVASLRNPRFKFLTDADGLKLSTTGHLITGGAARASIGAIMMPFTVLKTRFEAERYHTSYQSIIGAIQTILKTEGMAGLFRGWGSTLARDTPHTAIYVGTYERLKKHLDVEERPLRRIAASISSGIIASMLTQPFDMVRARIQISPNTHPNFFMAVGQVVGREGIVGLFRGLGLRLARKSMNSAVAWFIFEEMTSVGDRERR